MSVLTAYTLNFYLPYTFFILMTDSKTEITYKPGPTGHPKIVKSVGSDSFKNCSQNRYYNQFI